MSSSSLAQSDLTSLANGPIDLETSEISRSSSKASGRPRSVVDPDNVSLSRVGSRASEVSTQKDKENLERLLTIFNGGNGINMGFILVSAIKAQQIPVTAPDTEEAQRAVDILQASIAGYFTRQRTKLREARKDIKEKHKPTRGRVKVPQNWKQGLQKDLNSVGKNVKPQIKQKKRVTINDPEKGPTEIRLTQRVKTFYVDKWPEIKDVKSGRDTVLIPNLPTKSARARNMIGGTPISRETAIALRKITLGSVVHSFTTDWRKSGLLFHEITSKIAYGLQTLKCGSRAVVLCVQGFLLKHLLFAREYASSLVSTNALQPSEFERRKALCGAICEILWRAGSGIRCCVCLLQEEAIFDTDWQYRVDGITEKINLYEFKNFKDLELFVKRHVSHFEHENSNGCILLLYSLVLSRTIQMVYDDMDVAMGDDVKDKLLTDNEECTINLINLLLTGRATKNLHNGNVIYDADGKLLRTPLRGIKERSQVGLLFWDRDEDSDERTELGSMLKTPKYPIWLTLVNGQYGLLFSLNFDLVSDWRVEHHFTLYYYTGLAHQTPTMLTIDTRYLRRRPKTGISKKYQEERIPALEQCIMTKWYGASIDWNGVFPYI